MASWANILSRATLVALLFAAFGCEAQPEATPEMDEVAPPDRTSPDGQGVQDAPPPDLTEEQKLMLIQEVPLGVDYAYVEDRFQTVGPEEREALGAGDQLSQAFLPVSILNEEGTLEFNFDDDALYSYYYRLDSLACDVGEQRYDELNSFYSDYFGDAREEEEQANDYRSRSSFWRMGEQEGAVAMTLGEQSDVCRLSWGFQQQVP